MEINYSLLLLVFVLLSLLFCLEYERKSKGKKKLEKFYRSYKCLFGLINTPYRFLSYNSAYLPMGYFKSHSLILKNFSKIRDEVVNLMNSNPDQLKGFADVIYDSKGISHQQWVTFWLKLYKKNCTRTAEQLLPITSNLIQQCPDVHLAMISILQPGASIKAHYGPVKSCYRYLLTLSCCPSGKGFISVDNKQHFWKAILFDDTYRHYVENPTSKDRVVLFLDVERKLYFPFNIINRFILLNAGIIPKFRKMQNQVYDVR
ncbi:aspartyl/asparaginyl beta-hydroxylase domain-containing protein [Legionella pneumophila]|uniref:aspartyl/asparaginyl beta-hydroxylase domain-containing protein n=1 Tax=Legionella pneumophila TaxID=446 RepID=UPI0007784479|nr:aspartyl/asparaginyl beta-hydroxylase domain-containing protein [Legionella pneumophila]